MLRHLQEYGKNVEITGYRNVGFAVAEDFLKSKRGALGQVDVQFFDADLIATKEHLFFAVLNALQAFKTKTNLSKSLAMETMLYASAKRQIQRAIVQCGIKPETTKIATVIISQDAAQIKVAVDGLTAIFGSEPDESVLELSAAKEKRIKEAFGISNEETETVKKNEGSSTLVDLVIEHVALLASQL